MGRPTLAESRDTRTELLEAAMDLVQTVGFTSFSYQDLADRLDIKKASIHYHFKTKEDLGIGLMERSLARFGGWVERIQAQNLSSLTELDSYFDYFARLSQDGTRVCPCGRMISEWPSLPPVLQETATRLLNAHREFLKRVVEKGRKAGEIVKIGTVEEQAQFIFASVQGALQTSRAQQSPEYFRAVTRQIANGLKV